MWNLKRDIPLNAPHSTKGRKTVGFNPLLRHHPGCAAAIEFESRCGLGRQQLLWPVILIAVGQVKRQVDHCAAQPFCLLFESLQASWLVAAYHTVLFPAPVERDVADPKLPSNLRLRHSLMVQDLRRLELAADRPQHVPLRRQQWSSSIRSRWTNPMARISCLYQYGLHATVRKSSRMLVG